MAADPRTTGLLSEFNDPPEDPLREGGNWAKSGGNVNPGDLDMRKSGGVASDTTHPTVLSGYIGRSYWTPRQYSGDVEVWGLPTGGQLGAALETWRLFMLQNPIGRTYGYLVFIGGGLSKSTVIRRYDGDNNDPTVIASGSGSYCDALLLRTKGDQVEAWAENSGVWNLRCAATDNVYRGPFSIGMGIEDPTNGGLAWDAFGGGKPNIQQIYRIIRGLQN